MKQSVNIIYAIITAVIAFVFIMLEIQPAVSLMYVFSAPGAENTYYVAPVLLILWLMFLSPLFIYHIVAKALRNKNSETIAADRTGIFVSREKAFQSAMVGIPVFIDGKKAGIIDNGKTRFFDMPSGMHTVHAGRGRQTSEKLQINITEKQQLQFKMEIMVLGFHFKYDLKQV